MMLGTAVLACCLLAERHALLIGIGTYGRESHVSALDGPVHDVEAMRLVLVKRAAFPEQNVRTLVNQQATRAAILGELKGLASRAKAGDTVVFFYSGHGTSNGDPVMRRIVDDPQTGALLPYDVKRGTRDEVRGSLIIGRRDIRPVFEELDKKNANVLALFDTCYSQDAAKDVLTESRPRNVALGSLVADAFDRDEKEDIAGLSEEAFPYANIIAISAAARNQQAREYSALRLGVRPHLTLDGKPHGYFTDGILRALAAGAVTHQGLFHSLQKQALGWSQDPQIQYSTRNAVVLDRPLFGGMVPEKITLQALALRGKAVRVGSAGVGPLLRLKLGAMAGVTLTDKDDDADVLIRYGSWPGKFLLVQGNGLAMHRAEFSTEEMLQRVEAEPAVQELIRLRPVNERNPLMFKTVGERLRGGQTVFVAGQKLQFEVKAARVSYFLLLNIDAAGVVTVVYPSANDAIEAVDATVPKLLGAGGGIRDPFGIEHLKLFAFEERPAEYNSWRGSKEEGYRTFEPGSAAFADLLNALRKQRLASEATLRIITRDQ